MRIGQIRIASYNRGMCTPADDEDDYDDNRTDPIEDDPVLGPLVAAARAEANESLADSSWKGESGYCHLVWSVQKRILKERHGIDWKTPKEMNPSVRYD